MLEISALERHRQKGPRYRAVRTRYRAVSTRYRASSPGLRDVGMEKGYTFNGCWSH